MKLRHIVVTVTAAATIAATASSMAQAEPRGFRPPSDSLRSYASQIGLHLGVAANPEVLADEELAGIAADEFSSITPENEMKWETVEPTRGTYDWSGADEVVEFVIQGVTLDGKPFRPSDWAERLCGVMSAFGGDHRMQYSPFVHPVTANGVRCVVVDRRLEELEPQAYRFLMNFAKDNELKTRDGRIAERTKLAEMQRVGDTA